MKDNFSSQSDKYAKYRPTYPAELFEYLNSIVTNKGNAWDCGTGNGQIAFQLAKTFSHVFATDISQKQINNALQAGNITYSVQPAESTNFNNQSFDLITIGQAIHWFDFEKFYAEVKRAAKEKAIICAVGYGMAKVSKQIDSVIAHFYNHVTGPYWDKERKYIDENYQTIPFPFKEIEAPNFANRLNWSFDHLIGYLNTWSAVKHYIKQNRHNPVDELKKKIELHWGKETTREVSFPLLLRVGKISSKLN